MREIVVLTSHDTGPSLTSFTGRWLAQYLDPVTGGRYSVAQRGDGVFVTIVQYDSGEPVEMRVFADVAAICDADLPISLKSAAERAPDARFAPQLPVVQRTDGKIIPKDQLRDPDPPNSALRYLWRSGFPVGSLRGIRLLPMHTASGTLRYLRRSGFPAGSLRGIRLLPMHTAKEVGLCPR
jgi:hypothetical protein